MHGSRVGDTGPPSSHHQPGGGRGGGGELDQVEGGVGLRSIRQGEGPHFLFVLSLFVFPERGQQGLPITTTSLSCSLKTGSSQQQGHDKLVSLTSSRGLLIGLRQKIKRMVSYFSPVIIPNCLRIHGPYSIRRQFLILAKRSLPFFFFKAGSI